MKKQTAVEWLFLMLNNPNSDQEFANNLLEQAKAMEKEQIMEAVDVGFEEGAKFPEDIKLNNAEQYYTSTYE